MARKIEYGRMLHGGDYNPEQWLDRPDILKKDIEYFKKAHINTVSVGIFSWAVLEPEEGKYNLGWLEEIIDNLYKEGISTILATPSGARPKWMTDKYPEVLRMDPDRTRRFFGGRHNHCYTSPVYRQKVHDMDKLLSQRLGSHPGVILWHISNEFGGECYCPLCQQKFREWLKEKYGTIEKLNSSWCTTFWSHIYNSFDQIEAPSPKGENELHALKLDWNRFVTDRTIDFIKGEVAAIREGGSELPVTANLMYDYNGLDYKKFRDVLDVVSWDNYPSWHKKEEFFTAIDAGMQHDLMRSIKNQPFLLMESCPSATNWKPINKLKKPGMMLAASLQAVAHGSDSVLYFQLHQSQGASEKFHGAVIDHYGGEDTGEQRRVCYACRTHMQQEYADTVARYVDHIGCDGDIHGHIGLTNAAAEGGTSIINRQGWKRQCGDKQIGFASRQMMIGYTKTALTDAFVRKAVGAHGARQTGATGIRNKAG